jgi:hypothetical protein
LVKLLATRKSRRRPFGKSPYRGITPVSSAPMRSCCSTGGFFWAESKKLHGEIEELLVGLYLLQEYPGGSAYIKEESELWQSSAST